MPKSKKVKKLVLPVSELPSGRGWELKTGNTELNVWVRK
jgi:hypothetical protein